MVEPRWSQNTVIPGLMVPKALAGGSGPPLAAAQLAGGEAGGGALRMAPATVAAYANRANVPVTVMADLLQKTQDGTLTAPDMMAVMGVPPIYLPKELGGILDVLSASPGDLAQFGSLPKDFLDALGSPVGALQTRRGPIWFQAGQGRNKPKLSPAQHVRIGYLGEGKKPWNPPETAAEDPGTTSTIVVVLGSADGEPPCKEGYRVTETFKKEWFIEGIELLSGVVVPYVLHSRPEEGRISYTPDYQERLWQENRRLGNVSGDRRSSDGKALRIVDNPGILQAGNLPATFTGTVTGVIEISWLIEPIECPEEPVSITFCYTNRVKYANGKIVPGGSEAGITDGPCARFK